jgi:hypothetical protein
MQATWRPFGSAQALRCLGLRALDPLLNPLRKEHIQETRDAFSS